MHYLFQNENKKVLFFPQSRPNFDRNSLSIYAFCTILCRLHTNLKNVKCSRWESQNLFCVASSNRCKSVHKSEGQKSVSHKEIGFDHPSYRTSPNKEQFLHEKPILSPKTSYCIINNHKAVHTGLWMLKFWNWVNKKITVKAKIDIFLAFILTNF